MQMEGFIKLARIRQPVGILLLLFPSWWGLALASPELPSFYYLFVFALGAILMRSAGCVYNDMVDKDFDKKVRRTIHRPIASGEIPVYQGVLFLLALLAPAALILFSLPAACILVGLIALTLVFIYPWMKRITYWPQVFLGITFNTGIFIGWFAITPNLSLSPIFLFMGAILWTIGYDTIYAFQDRTDDLLAGVKSSALVVASYPKFFLSIIYGLVLLFWIMAGKTSQLGLTYWIFLTSIAIHFAWQVKTLEINKASNCFERFSSNVNVGFLLFIAIVFSRLID